MKWDPKASQENQASLHYTPARQEFPESQGPKDSRGPPDHLDRTVSSLALKEDQERRALLGPPVSLGLADRKDGKVKSGTVKYAQAISSSRLSRGCQDRRAYQASAGSRGRKGFQETLAITAPLGSQGSRESLVKLDLLDPKE